MLRRTLAVVASSGALLLVGASASGDESESESDLSWKPWVVRTVVKWPARHIEREIAFVPWAAPTVEQVHRIILVEAAGDDGVLSTLERRIGCESGFRWDAVNGPYVGLGQFHPDTFRRGLSTIGSRSVRLDDGELVRYRRTRVREWWSNGRRTTRKGKRVRVVFHRVLVGELPVSPPTTHGWAQVRIMTQAIRGQSAVGDGEWECR